MAKSKDNTLTWIMNEHGVKSTKPAWQAQEFVETRIGWKYCEPDDVPKTKRYPLTGGQYTEEGIKRRQAAKQRFDDPVETKATALEDKKYAELQKMATAKGISPVGKKKTELIELLSE